MFYWRWFNRPRHPLLRLLFGLIGVVLLLGVLVFGFFALLAFAFIGAIVAITRAVARSHAGVSHAPRTAGADARVIEGEFVVVRNGATTLNH
jgi:hypothetical protein